MTKDEKRFQATLAIYCNITRTEFERCSRDGLSTIGILSMARKYAIEQADQLLDALEGDGGCTP